MATETLNIIVRLKDQASRNLRKLGIGLKTVGSITCGLSSALFSLKGAIAGIGAGLLAKSFLSAATSAEQYRTRLTVLLKSQSEGNRLFKEMSEFASTVSFSYEEIMGSATNLAGVMRGGVDEIKEWMPGIANLAAAAGLSIQDTTGQIIRMYSAGAASADLFRERGVLAMLGFQAGVSYSAEETRKRLMEIFDDPNAQIAGAATELAKTWQGMLGMIGDAWFQFRNLVMESGVFDYLKSAVRLFLDFIERLKSEGRLDEWAQNIAEVVLDSFGVILKGIGIVADAWRGWKLIWHSLIVVFAPFAKLINEGLYYMARVAELVFSAMGEHINRFGELLQKIPVWVHPGARALGEMLANSKSMSKLTGDMATTLKANSEIWDEQLATSMEQLLVLSAEESSLTRMTNLHDLLIKKTMEALAASKKAREETGTAITKPTAPVPTASIGAILASQLARSREAMRTSLADLQAVYGKGEIQLAEYFNRRKQMIIDQFKLELAILEEQSKAVAGDPDKRLAIEDKIFALRQAHHRALLAMDLEEASSQDDLVAKRLKALGSLAKGTEQVYELSGRKMKEFFYVSKAASVAQTVMSTYQGAQAAFTGMTTSIPGPVGIAAGIAAAAAAIVQGLARAAMIRGQALAEGGMVSGTSPHSKSDNINISATAGEFMQPVSAVRYYGKAAMEALKRKLIPREIFGGFTLPVPHGGRKFAYAEGGGVQGGIQPRAVGDGGIKIFNYTDRREMLAALNGPDGDDAIVNVISRNSDRINRVLR
jgi:hypothetical protein